MHDADAAETAGPGSVRPRGGTHCAWSPTTLLGRLPAPAREAFVGIGTKVTLAADRPILWQGEENTHAFLLLSGCTKVLVAAPNGESGSTLLAVRIGGDLVGEMSALTGRPRSATVHTCTETVARIIRRDELLAFVGRTPQVGMEIAAMLAERLRWANERRVDFASLRAPQRVAKILQELVTTYGVESDAGWELGARLTQAEIASLSGVKLPTAERALRSLQRAGVLELKYRQVVVTDVNALRNAGHD